MGKYQDNEDKIEEELTRYRPSLENGFDQLIVTLYTLSIYPSVYKKLIQTIFVARIVVGTWLLWKRRVHPPPLYILNKKNEKGN